jgi:hypothetical protein
MKKLILAAFAALLALPAHAQIISALPFNLQNGTTADATQVMANFNQILGDTNSNAAKNGANSDITSITGLTTPLSYTLGGSSVYLGGTVTGTANAIVLAAPTPGGFSLIKGKTVCFVATGDNSGTTTLNVASSGVTNLYKQTASGPAAMAGGEIKTGNVTCAQYDGTRYQLISPLLADSPLSGQVAFTGIITPTALSSTTNDWAPTGLSTASVIRASSSVDVTITGLSAQPSGVTIFLQNVGSNLLTLADSSGSSSAANQFSFGGADVVLGPSYGLVLRYDGTSSRWRSSGIYRAAATEAQAEAGTDNAASMSPLRVAQATAVTRINTQTANYVTVLGDAGKTVEMNVGSANTLTIPPNSSVAYPVGTYINVTQYGAGQTTLTPGSGVTIRARVGLKLTGQYSLATLYKRGTDEWVAGGDLSQ